MHTVAAHHANLLGTAVLALHLPQNVVPVGPAQGSEGGMGSEIQHKQQQQGVQQSRQITATAAMLLPASCLPYDDLMPTGAPSSRSRCAVSCARGASRQG